MYYSCFDLIFKSDNLALPELNELTVKDDIYDILITDEDKEWPPLYGGEYDTEFVKMKNNDFRLTIPEIAFYRVLNGKNIYWKKANSKVSDKDVKTFLLSSVFGALLIQRGLLLLHGNVLMKNQDLIICLGKSGVGKSTISYLLMKNGWEIISDDLATLNSNMDIKIGIQRIKLWEDTINFLKIDSSKLEKIRPNINKYILKKENLNISKKTIPLSSIFILYSEEEFKENKNFSDKIEVKKEITKLFFLRDNIYRPRFVKGLGKEAYFFSQLTKISKMFPIYLLPLPKGISNMENTTLKRLNEHYSNR